MALLHNCPNHSTEQLLSNRYALVGQNSRAWATSGQHETTLVAAGRPGQTWPRCGILFEFGSSAKVGRNFADLGQVRADVVPTHILSKASAWSNKLDICPRPVMNAKVWATPLVDVRAISGARPRTNPHASPIASAGDICIGASTQTHQICSDANFLQGFRAALARTS